MARRARCRRVHSATVNRPTGVPGGPIDRLHAWPAQRTLARSTAGSRVRHYNYFRSYSAERGRYTQADPIGLDGGFNRFGYVEGNALSFADFYGLITGAMSCKDIVSGSTKSKIRDRVESLLLESYTWFRPASYGPGSSTNWRAPGPPGPPFKPAIEITIQVIEHQKWRERIHRLTELFQTVLTECTWKEKGECGLEKEESISRLWEEKVGSNEELISDEIKWRERLLRTFTIPFPLPIP